MEPLQAPNTAEQLPQNVRINNAKVIVSQALMAATVSYQLTIQEQVLLAESVLNDARGNLLAFTAAQYERLAMPEQPDQTPPGKPEEPASPA